VPRFGGSCEAVTPHARIGRGDRVPAVTAPGKCAVVDSANRARPCVETRRLPVKCNSSRCGDAQRTATRWRPGTRRDDQSHSVSMRPPYSGESTSGSLLALGCCRKHRGAEVTMPSARRASEAPHGGRLNVCFVGTRPSTLAASAGSSFSRAVTGNGHADHARGNLRVTAMADHTDVIMHSAVASLHW